MAHVTQQIGSLSCCNAITPVSTTVMRVRQHIFMSHSSDVARGTGRGSCNPGVAYRGTPGVKNFWGIGD